MVESMRLRTSALIVAVWLLSGCGAGEAAPTPVTSPAAVTISEAPLPTTPHSTVFRPAFTYTLPDGWTISHDNPAMFRFLPIGFSNDDYDSGRTEGISLITDAGASNLDCTDTNEPGVGLDPEAIATELLSRPGIAATKKVASIGGLSGPVLDIRLASGWKTSCPDPPGIPAVPMINSAVYNQRIGGFGLDRLYLLDLRDSSLSRPGTLAIEIDDLTGGRHIEALSEIVRGFAFMP